MGTIRKPRKSDKERVLLEVKFHGDTPFALVADLVMEMAAVAEGKYGVVVTIDWLPDHEDKSFAIEVRGG